MGSASSIPWMGVKASDDERPFTAPLFPYFF